MLLVMFDLYLRPGEAHGLRVADVAAPVAGLQTAGGHWSFTVRPWDSGMPSKTGAFDDTVVMDRPDRVFLGNYLALLKQGKPASEKLFTGVTVESFNRAFRAAAAELGLDLVPYQARHGGATHDRWDRTRSLEEVRKRGRWRSEQSTRRYEKHGKLQGKLGALPPATLAHLVWCAKNVDALLSGTVLLSQGPPPAAALQPETQLVHIDMCQYGSPWRKATSFLCWNCPEMQRLATQCRPTRGICSRSRRRHLHLHGWAMDYRPRPGVPNPAGPRLL